MKYPRKIEIYHEKDDGVRQGDKPFHVIFDEPRELGFSIFIDKGLTEHIESYTAKNARELLAFLAGVYEMPFWKKAGEELTRVYEELGEDEYYRRLGIGIAPGEEK